LPDLDSGYGLQPRAYSQIRGALRRVCVVPRTYAFVSTLRQGHWLAVSILFAVLLAMSQSAIWIGAAVNGGREISAQRGRTPESRDLRIDPDVIDAFIIDNMRRTGVPGVALAVVKNERVTYTAGYGVTASGRAIDPATPMFMASLSKSVTAAAVMQLIEAGKLTLTTPLLQALPLLHFDDERVATITVKQLLNQSSGINCSDVAVVAASEQHSLADALTRMTDIRLVAAPGSRWSYCNANYHLLAVVVERISGESFDAYLQRAILAPLGMSHTTSLVHLRDGNEPAGHTLSYGYALAHQNPNELSIGGSGLVSTADDIAKWLAVQLQLPRLESGDPIIGLSRDSIVAMHTPSAPNSNYGYGWRAESMLDGREYVFHSGRIIAHSSHAALYPSTGYGYAILWNSLHPLGAEQRSFIEGMNQLLAGQSPTLGRPVGRIVDGMLAVFTVLWATIGIVGALGARRWVAEARVEPVRRVMSMAAYTLVALGVLLLPLWSPLLIDQRLSIWRLFEMWPAVGILLATTGLASGVIVALRAKAMLKA